MTNVTERAIEISRSLEELNKELGENDILHSDTLQTLEGIRTHCATALLQDFNEASKEKIEDRLWDAHLKVHSSLRAKLRQLNEGGNAKIVERRKLSAEYLRFIKASQKFYRGYIRGLTVTFGGIPQLQRLARKFNHDDLLLSRNRLATASSPPNDRILRSCFRTLVQLGDLSRYRESELAKGDPNWSHAVSFYDLARNVFPGSGISYNQLAIVALADNDLFRAVYWLYRALSTEEPHPQADANLRRAFAKVSQAEHDGRLQDGCSGLTSSYLRAISRAHAKRLPSDLKILESQAVETLKHELVKEEPSTSLRKIFLIIFATTQDAQEHFTKAQGAENSYDTFVSTLRLTLGSICELFSTAKEQLLTRCRSNLHGAHEVLEDFAAKLSTTVALMRLCFLWSVKNVVILTNNFNPEVAGFQSRLWLLYADCLSLIARAFPLGDSSALQYMLEEDEDAIAFLPILCKDTKFVWLYPNGSSRTAWHEVPNKPDEAIETLHRARQCIQIGTQFFVDKGTPIEFDTDTFLFNCRGHDVPEDVTLAIPGSDSRAYKQADGACQEAEAERMVSDLVEDSVEAPSKHDEALSPTSRPQMLQNDIAGKKENSAQHGSGSTFSISMLVRNSQSPRAQPLSPHYKGSPSTPSLRPSHIPMSRTISNHSRALSSESASSWSPGQSGSTARPNTIIASTAPHRSSLGQAVTAAGSSPSSPAAGYGMGSSMLFGAGQSPWSMSEPESRRLSEAHERTNSSPRLMPKPLSPHARQPSTGPGASAWNDVIPSGGGGIEANMGTPSKWNVHAKPFK